MSTDRRRFVTHDIAWNAETIGNLWNSYASEPAKTAGYFALVLGGQLLDYIGRRMPLKGAAVLDYGSGPGHLLSHMVRRNLDVAYTAIDPSSTSIEQMRDRFTGSRQLRGAYLLDDVPGDLGGSFDVVFCIEVVEHLGDPELAAVGADLAGYVRPGGYVCVSTPHDEDLELQKQICPECGCRYHQWQHMRSWNPQSLRAFMEDLGFETQSCEARRFTVPSTQLKYLLLRLVGRREKPPHLVYIGRRR